MFGKRTAIILGAGASFCYGGGLSGIPTQQDIVGKLFFGADAEDSDGFPSFSGPSGPQHSFRLAKYLRKRFGIPEDLSKRNAKMDFWLVLQEQGFNLESLYAVLEAELTGDHRILLDDFEAIVRTAVLNPVRDRDRSSVCPHHQRICEAIEPGDYFINFNWDSVLTDTLLYHSHFWFPASGFGLHGVYPLLPPCQKARNVESLVQVYPIHGSVVLFELEDTEDKGQKGVLYLGPRQWSPFAGMLELNGISPTDIPLGSSFNTRAAEPWIEERLFAHGYIYLKGKWFKPLFIPPSKNKPQYRHWFFERVLSGIHSVLPSTQHLVIAGYSFPDADTAYLQDIFVPGIISKKVSIEVINPDNSDTDFQKRVKAVFPGVEDIRFDHIDFRAFCAKLPIEFPDRPNLNQKPDVPAQTDEE